MESPFKFLPVLGAKLPLKMLTAVKNSFYFVSFLLQDMTDLLVFTFHTKPQIYLIYTFHYCVGFNI